MAVRQVELRYNAREIDTKWQERWERDGVHHVSDDDPRPKWYELTMYPYPSGDLHIGHWYAMAPADSHARFRRMQGYNVLHPMGFDAFGLPAENAAIQRGVHPYSWTMGNIENMRRQLRSLGTVYDWDRELICCVPEYYRWNQWFFLKLYENGLAYRAKAPVVWCPSCVTVLANEQVLNGKCERCDTAITRRDLSQWFFKITAYADRLLDFSGLEDWPEKILIMQKNWVGRSEGVEISFDISHCGIDETEIRTFTTRIDTIFGVTFLVLAPEHPLVEKLTTEEHRQEVETYVEKARSQTEIERLAAERDKTGVFVGSHVINHLNGERVPIYIADYALMGYGTGAVMGVPAHDQRDFEFANKYGLPIRVVISPPGWEGGALSEAYLGNGGMVNSGQFDGAPNAQGMESVADLVESRGWGKRAVSYRIRDWLISRQRYWGTPIPIVYCDVCGIVPVPESDLPVLLPPDAEFKPTGESPLATHTDFVNTTCPSCGAQAHRETDTMDTFVDSSWYMERFTSPKYDQGPFDPRALSQWMPVTQYTGGAEHAVMHLLYARFFTKALRDLGVVGFGEPFLRLYNQGVILGEDSEKMSKSRGNVVNPDEYVNTLGADSVRCFLMFLGPWDQGGPWSSSGINGVARWLNRVWEVCQQDPATRPPENPSDNDFWEPLNRAARRALHQTIKRVYRDLDKFKFNTAIAALMEYTNHLSRTWEAPRGVDGDLWREGVEKFLLMLAPLAPHVAEELWERTGHSYSIHEQTFPEWDDELTAEDEITLVVQVNGKLRDKIPVPAGISEEEAKDKALEALRKRDYVNSEKQPEKIFYVPGRLVNVVMR